jgi:NitT/TauT family transport system permease protein
VGGTFAARQRPPTPAHAARSPTLPTAARGEGDRRHYRARALDSSTGSGMKQSTAETLSPWLFTIGIFLFWEFAVRAFKVDPFILPPPSAAFAAMAQYWWPLTRHSFVTLWTTMAGFALAVAFGILLGLVVGWSRTIYRGLYPVMIGFNCIPKVAVVPILIMWFGIGEVPAVLTAFLISFFPIVVNVATGLATMEPELEDVLRALGAKKLDIMLKVGIPRTQPYLFGSLKVAITLAFVGTVVSETVGANAGLGYQIALAGSNFQMPLVFAALLLLAIEGIAMYAVFAYVETRFTRWAFRSSMSAAA